MKTIALILASCLLLSFTNWGTSFDKAKEEASASQKCILLYFSGSDWCGPCIRLHNEIFGKDAFSKYADSALVLVNADFPRQKKHKLSKELQQQNDQLADKYNSKGTFPLTVLLNAKGKVLKEWEGFPKQTPEEFTSDVKAVVDASK